MTQRRVLLIAFHFPPMAGSSGVQRTLRFAQHLPEFGWEPVVMTAKESVYFDIDRASASAFAFPVHRSSAFDAARQLSIFGRYPSFIASPDRWISWALSAVPLGLHLIKRYRPNAIWSTYPIATAHVIGHLIHKLTGVPWIADFRDPMAHEGYPADPRLWKAFESIERRIFGNAAAATFTTQGTRSLYAKRYGWPEHKLHLIENGFDELAFISAEQLPAAQCLPNRLTLLHSGVIYPEWRNPRNLFRALHKVNSALQSPIGPITLKFRGSGHDSYLLDMAKAENVDQHVEALPLVPYIVALREMLDSDGLLLIQSAGCNDQIPAKSYEYIRAGKPILALTDHAGETAKLVSSFEGSFVADIESPVDIESMLLQWANSTQRPGFCRPEESIMKYSRRAGTACLAKVLDRFAIDENVTS